MKKQSVDIEKLLKSMTVEEKAAQMMVLPYSHMTKERAYLWIERGIGAFLHVWGEEARALRAAAAKTKCGIPLIIGIDAVHGHCLNDCATVFPTQLSMACSFNPALIKQMARMTAKEVSADNINWTFSPVLCLGRDLRWGRVAETFGEDKYLAGELGRAMIEGYQGDALSDKGSILACAKHYIGYGEATGGRDSYDTEITERKMRAELLPPFEKAVKAGCKTFMTAYGSLDGVPCTADKRLLRDILKNELMFDGFVVTDWNNIGHLIGEQHIAKDFREASRIAVESGNDMMMATERFYERVVDLFKSGELSESLLDDAVRRILSAKAALGLFEDPCKAEDRAYIGCKEHMELCRTLARECVVLLKNENRILPLSEQVKRIAVIGACAEDILAHYGDWTFFTHPSENKRAVPKRPCVTFLDGMRTLASRYGKELTYQRGCEILSEDKAALDAAQRAAEQSDVVFFVCGDTIERTGEAKDIALPELTKPQKALFCALKQTGKPIVTVFISSKPLCLQEEAKGSAAFLTCFNGGMFGGEALAEAVFGEFSPCGKLPISFARAVGEQPTYYNTLSGWHCKDYADLSEKKSFVFGEGLSYTEFAYSDAVFDSETLTLKVKLKNAGTRQGKEITEVYFEDLISSVMTPVKQLIAFAKTELAAGEEKELIFAFDKKDFSLVNTKCERVTEKGEFRIMVGGSSKNEDLISLPFSIEE